MYRKIEKVGLALLIAFATIGCRSKEQKVVVLEVEESNKEIALNNEKLTETFVVDMGENEEVVIEMGVTGLTEEATFFGDIEKQEFGTVTETIIETTEELSKSEEESEEIVSKEEDVKKEISENACCEFEKYRNMNAVNQKAFVAQFEDMDDFFDWYDNAEIEHEKHDTTIEIGKDPIDMDKIINGDSKSE